MTSLVEKLTAGEFLLFRHSADTQESGKREREDEWTGGKESYRLTEKDGTTTLTTVFDVSSEMEQYFKDNYPKALEQVKVMAERN